ncbi:MAG: hypothetical protein O2923_08035 [Verrucomicrobia bacterium]|nr:hypothetical protein [Verrucomicrobiota bacterium]MDA1087324.1 hypothetical protein [Verrucomicrobiota bacterium]
MKILPTHDYQHLLDQWDKHKRNCRLEVIAGLTANSLMTFSDPVYEKIWG